MSGEVDVYTAPALRDRIADLLDSPRQAEAPCRRRIGGWLVERVRTRLEHRIAADIAPLFKRYHSGQASFADTRAALLDCVRVHGTLAYVAPRT